MDTELGNQQVEHEVEHEQLVASAQVFAIETVESKAPGSSVAHQDGSQTPVPATSAVTASAKNRRQAEYSMFLTLLESASNVSNEKSIYHFLEAFDHIVVNTFDDRWLITEPTKTLSEDDRLFSRDVAKKMVQKMKKLKPPVESPIKMRFMFTYGLYQALRARIPPVAVVNSLSPLSVKFPDRQLFEPIGTYLEKARRYARRFFPAAHDTEVQYMCALLWTHQQDHYGDVLEIISPAYVKAVRTFKTFEDVFAWFANEVPRHDGRPHRSAPQRVHSRPTFFSPTQYEASEI